MEDDLILIKEVANVNENLKNLIREFYDTLDLAKKIYKIQPFFYDGAKIWWFWNKEEFRWEQKDDTDVLLFVRKHSIADTISSKNKNEILEAMRQIGRGRIPKPIKEDWIQFRDIIIDIKNGDEFKATPDYFVTNPIPYGINKDKYVNTPTMDKIFIEWVGEEYYQLLYEIIAYCILPSYPLHRIFCFMGSGLNGKTKYLELIRKFIGSHNCTSTELDVLLTSRFEVTRLHKKLVCQMGETNFTEMNKTSLLKKLSGGDLIGFEYKNKTPFEDKNYAKILIATNNLPATSDKTIGFFRRWVIIDFPFVFSEKKDILKDIPEEEYESLANKCVCILKNILQNRKFTKEGEIEDRMKRYEDRSDFLKKFINENIIESLGKNISKNEFGKRFQAWCFENKFRMLSNITINKRMKELGIEDGRIYASWLYDGKGGQYRAWIDVTWKD